MNLGFSTQINGKPTHFVEKIYNGLTGLYLPDLPGTFFNGVIDCMTEYDIKYGLGEANSPKIHTIRADEKNRWKVGNKIHFVINNRKKDRFQFAPVLMVKSIQKISIIKHGNANYGSVYIDGKTMSPHDLQKLSANDGFDSVADFFKWFDKDFDGKIIHWTNFVY